MALDLFDPGLADRAPLVYLVQLLGAFTIAADITGILKYRYNLSPTKEVNLDILFDRSYGLEGPGLFPAFCLVTELAYWSNQRL